MSMHSPANYFSTRLAIFGRVQEERVSRCVCSQIQANAHLKESLQKMERLRQSAVERHISGRVAFQESSTSISTWLGSMSKRGSRLVVEVAREVHGLSANEKAIKIESPSRTCTALPMSRQQQLRAVEPFVVSITSSVLRVASSDRIVSCRHRSTRCSAIWTLPQG